MERERLVELVGEAAAGQRLAAELLFHEFSPRVWRLALRYTRGGEEEAKDIVQDAFMKAFSQIDSLRDRGSFGSWIMQITSNVALGRIRSNQREGRFLARLSAEQSLPGNSRDPLLRELKIHAVQQLLAELPDDGPARVLKLHYGDPPMSTADIARQLDMPKGTVTVTLKRFRERIRAQLIRRIAEVEEKSQRVE